MRREMAGGISGGPCALPGLACDRESAYLCSFWRFGLVRNEVLRRLSLENKET